MTHTLYAMPQSLYSGKARSYLIKQHIPFDEITPGDPHYFNHILPQTKRLIMPVVATPEDEVIQDGSAIIDWFEESGLARQSAYAADDRLNVISLIFELFGGEGLLRPAMHYRWNYFDQNKEVLDQGFAALVTPGVRDLHDQEKLKPPMDQMRMASKAFGVVESTVALIEKHYEEWLEKFDRHLRQVPYLLGGVPTIGDYGLIAALFAHLGRDPAPLNLMLTKAPYVYRWVERMNRPGSDRTEFADVGDDLISFDAIPETLKSILQFVAEDYLPEIRAFVAFTNQYLEDNPEVKEGDVIGGDNPTMRMIGATEFSYRGVDVSVIVLPYRQYLLQRIQDRFDGLSDGDKADVQALLDNCGLSDILTARVTRRIERSDNLEVWGA